MGNKSRTLPHSLGVGKRRFRYLHDPIAPNVELPVTRTESETLNTLLKGTQYTESEGHPWRSRKVGSLEDIGGNFFTQKKWYEDMSVSVAVSDERLLVGPPRMIEVQTYFGPIYCTNPWWFPFAAYSFSSAAELETLGATAIARCKPTNSVADLATALGELAREKLPHLPGSQTWKSRAQKARDGGSEYLNVEFGWKPLIGEVLDLADGVTAAERLLSQYERDAGKVVRRRYQFPSTSEISSEIILGGGSVYPSIGSNFMLTTPPPEDLVLRRHKQRRTWFSGAFTYYLPSGYDSRKELSRLSLLSEKILGLEITPETLWNLAPWSWAVDWFSNTGDVISNVSSWINDGLVLHYGYVMEHTIEKHIYSRRYSPLKDQNASISDVCLVTETKQRRKAGPYGFGIDWGDLSPRQLAIIGALGLSRSSQ